MRSLTLFQVITALAVGCECVTPTPHPAAAPEHPASPYPTQPPPYHHKPAEPYHPTPYHPQQYMPTPHPYAPAHNPHMTPGYGYSPAPPAYGHPSPSYGYTPAPGYAAPHHAPTYAAPAHHPAPAYGPAPKHKPAPHKHHEGPPACSKNTTKTWCLEDAEYPAYEISHAIEYNYAGVASLYKDVLANTENSVDRLVELPQETYLCASATAYLMPLRAVNTEGKWRIIVNGVKAHYETLTQTARVEECSSPGSACPLVPECYSTKCIQKSIYHRYIYMFN